MKSKKIIIIIIVILIIIAGTFLTISALNKKINYDLLTENPDISDIEETEEEKKELNDLKIGNELYGVAIKMYQMKPYCGVFYENIDSKDKIKENNKEYYNSHYASIAEINNEINKYFVYNTLETITDYIAKDGYVYCEYAKRNNSENYIGEYYLDIVNSSDNIVEFTANTSHIAPSHDEACTVDNYIDCTQDDKETRTSKFVIEKVNDVWKIKEFHNPYELGFAF